MISVEKPGSPAEVLEHHGTKGMKWGVRNQKSREFRRAHPTREQRNIAISRARHKVNTASAPSRDDRATALRLKSGEKFVLGVLAVSGVFTLPIAAGTGILVKRRHNLEN